MTEKSDLGMVADMKEESKRRKSVTLRTYPYSLSFSESSNVVNRAALMEGIFSEICKAERSEGRTENAMDEQTTTVKEQNDKERNEREARNDIVCGNSNLDFQPLFTFYKV